MSKEFALCLLKATYSPNICVYTTHTQTGAVLAAEVNSTTDRTDRLCPIATSQLGSMVVRCWGKGWIGRA